MNRSTQKRIAAVAAIVVLLIWVGAMLSYDTAIHHYWVDESPGPTYVKYGYMPAEVLGRQILLMTLGVAISAVVYLIIAPAD